MRVKNERLKKEDRRLIKVFLGRGETLKSISDAIGCDPTTISKEIKRNRIIYKEGLKGYGNDRCKKIERYPYTCNNCVLRYSTCLLTKYIYDDEKAQTNYKKLLIQSRQGLNTNESEFRNIESIIHEGIKNKEGIYHIVKSNDIRISVPTIYRWIDRGIMSTRKIDLPYAPKYKMRKKIKEKYDYSAKNNKIDRSGRTYLDYLRFKLHFPGLFVSQIDFLGSVVTDSKSILTLIIGELHFPILYLIDRPNMIKIKEFFDLLEANLGLADFYRVFPGILGDRDPSFNDYDGIETSLLDSTSLRTQMFYCDPFESSQKPYVENLNKQLRLYIPKGSSIESYTDSDVKAINKTLIERKIKSLGGQSPKEAFIEVFGEKIFDKISKVII